MARKSANELLFEATTPSLGVRLWIEPNEDNGLDMVCVHAANEGGRGTALVTVLVPVEPLSATQVKPAMDLDDFLSPNPATKNGVKSLLWRKGTSVLPTPFTRRWFGDQWRQITTRTEWVLVLMIYPNPRLAQATADLETDGVAALKAFFEGEQGGVAEHPAAWIRRGLVHLARIDIPPSRTHVAADDDDGAPAELGTAPAADASFTFALASCQYPAGLVDGTPQRHRPGGAVHEGPADASMLRLAARLDALKLDDTDRPSLLVLTGDQIYADATAGLFDPRAGGTPRARSSIRQAEDWLRIPYQNWLGSVGAQSVLSRLRSLMMLDDHEIDDNWEPLTLPARPGEGTRMDLLMQAGSQAYQRYQRNLFGSKLLDHLWHARTHRQIRFFMADTRTERDARDAATDPRLPCIMSGNQAIELYTWIEQDPAQPAFVVSPAMLLPRRRSSLPGGRSVLRSDAWDGYPGSLYRLLVQIWKTGRSNLVFLSGDEHLSSVVKATVTKADVPDRAVTLHSVHSSGLYSPYPFANAVPEQFALPDDWDFDDPDERGAKYRCEVKACMTWVPGDGFALLSLAPPNPESGDWQLDVRFDRATDDVPACPTLILAPGPGPIQLPPA